MAIAVHGQRAAEFRRGKRATVQGKAVAGALARLGKNEFSAVRVGKRFELTVDGPVDESVLADVKALADDMLSNSVIEDVVSITVLEVSTGSTSGAK